MKRIMKVTSLLGLAAVLGGWTVPLTTVNANEKIKNEPVALELTQSDVKVLYKETFEPESIVVSGRFDSVSYPVVDTTQIGEQTVTYIATKGLETIKVNKTIQVVDGDAPVLEGPDALFLRWDSDKVITDYYTATDEVDSEVTIEVRNEPNRKEAGNYVVQVVAIDDSGNETIKDVAIEVGQNLPPVIQGPNALNFKYNSKVRVLDYYEAVDDLDGPVTITVIGDIKRTTPGAQKLTLEASDQHGNKSSRTITVNVAPDQAPVITGPSVLNFKYDSKVDIKSQYKASDDVDGNLAVSVVGTVDRTTAGTYTVKVEAVDSANQKTVKTVTIKVAAKPVPVVISGNTAVSGSRATAIGIARQFVGYRYVLGGASPSRGFDCSGLTKYVYGQLGIYLPHSARSQSGYGVRTSDPQPGDLAFYGGTHVGIYLGNGQILHAMNPRDGIRITGTRMSTGYPTQYRRLLP